MALSLLGDDSINLHDDADVVLLVGVNGVGKTTTAAKLASRAKGAGLSPLLVAADTFRAAAIDQLRALGVREGVEVVEESLILNTIRTTNRLHLLLKLGELKFTFILACLSIGSPTFDWRDSIETCLPYLSKPTTQSMADCSLAGSWPATSCQGRD